MPKNAETVIVIRDGEKELRLHRTVVHGVEVYTTTEEQQKDLEKRYAEILPPAVRAASSSS